jgi:hypothetical protein
VRGWESESPDAHLSAPRLTQAPFRSAAGWSSQGALLSSLWVQPTRRWEHILWAFLDSLPTISLSECQRCKRGAPPSTRGPIFPQACPRCQLATHSSSRSELQRGRTGRARTSYDCTSCIDTSFPTSTAQGSSTESAWAAAKGCPPSRVGTTHATIENALGGRGRKGGSHPTSRPQPAKAPRHSPTTRQSLSQGIHPSVTTHLSLGQAPLEMGGRGAAGDLALELSRLRRASAVKDPKPNRESHPEHPSKAVSRQLNQLKLVDRGLVEAARRLRAVTHSPPLNPPPPSSPTHSPLRGVLHP